MQDDRERRAFQEIEKRLAAEDPAFARRMRGARPARRPRLSSAAGVLCVVFFIATPVLAMLGQRTATVISLIVLLVTGTAFVRGRRR
jgi:ATP/ADP translocase